MKKHLLAISIAISGWAFGQAPVPTSYGFNSFPTDLPTGWSAKTDVNGTASGNTYQTGNTAAPSLKLDATGEYLMINVAQDPGEVSFYLKSSVGNGVTSFNGTFKVQESVNGTTFTDLNTYNSTNVSISAFELKKVTPAATSRYIRFYFSDKQSGANIALDDVSIAAPGPGVAQEINVKFDSQSYFSGATVDFNATVGADTTLTFTIENLGTQNTLNLSAAPTISGAAASDYSVTAYPATVAANSTGVLTVKFNPSAAGSRPATLSITSDDANENPYLINLYGIGGSTASEPTANASSVAFANVKTYRFQVSFTAANPAPDGGYIVLRKTGSSAITDVPTDGVDYERGDIIGSSQVAYIGTGTNFYPKSIIAGTTYQFAVFAFNGVDQYKNYISSAATGSVTTPATMMPANEYSGISSANPTLIADLKAKQRPHTQIYYSNYVATMVNLFSSRDTVDGKKAITDVYSGTVTVYQEPFTLTGTDFSREHTFCHSWMPTNPADNPELPEYDDQHHLFPSNFSKANQIRSNYPLGEVVNITSSFGGAKFGTDANGKTVYEPRDGHKGDAARALFYVTVIYNGDNGNLWYLPPNQNEPSKNQDQNILKKWHFQDPPDGYEMARNDFLDSLQGNRNPFVDSLDFVCHIDFKNTGGTGISYIANPANPCSTTGYDEIEKLNISVYPNPSNGTFSVVNFGNFNENVRLSVADVTGRVVYSKHNLSLKENLTLSLNEPAGIYILELEAEGKTYRQKLVIE